MDFASITSDPHMHERLQEHLVWLKGERQERILELAEKFSVPVGPREQMIEQLVPVITTDQVLRETIYIYSDEQPLVGWRDIPGEGPWRYGWFQGGDDKAGTIRVQPIEYNSEPVDVPYSLNLEFEIYRHPKLDLEDVELDFDLSDDDGVRLFSLEGLTKSEVDAIMKKHQRQSPLSRGPVN